MVTVGSNGVSLASAISTAFVNISTPRTFPVLCYLAAGIVNFFVPSGGGQWAIQGPIMMPAGLELGVTPAVTAMGIAWVMHGQYAAAVLGASGTWYRWPGSKRYHGLLCDCIDCIRYCDSTWFPVPGTVAGIK